MIWKIARQEFTEMWRDGRFMFVGAMQICQMNKQKFQK